MSEQKYPDWLIDRLVEAIMDKPSASMPALMLYKSDCEDDVLDARQVAVQVLDALGFTKQFAMGKLVAGRYLSWVPSEQGGKWYAKWEATTEWTEVEP